MIQMPVERQFEQKHIPVPDFVEQLAAQLCSIVLQYMSAAEAEQIVQALRFALDTYLNAPDEGSISRLEQALAVAMILAENRIDAVGVAAGLICEAVDGELITLERVESSLGSAVSRVVGSMLTLNILERKKQTIAQAQTITSREGGSSREQKKQRVREAMRHQQAETVRKMFLALAEDPRVVLLKLAYRLHVMRLIYAHNKYAVELQDILLMAEETRDVYAPLAGRLGMSRIESELQDLAFEVLEPEKCAWVRSQIEYESEQRRSYVRRVCAVLREEMARIGLKAYVSGRVKHVYSFYKKLQRNTGNVERLEDLRAAADFNQIQDLLAFRILVDSVADCYLALGHVHTLWKPKDGWIKDFIGKPKSNGYQSLHTTVFCLDDQLAEIQIRTLAMHEIAEYGVATHWHYKECEHGAAVSGRTSTRELSVWLRHLAEWQHELSISTANDSEYVEAAKNEILQEEQIYVFTPKGEVKDLPIGSTPVDFAYRIHTAIGNLCAGARIITESGSGDAERLVTRMVPLDYELKSGEIVEVVTNRTAHPTRDWLNFARTRRAHYKIRRYLKLHERDINSQIGRERLDRELKMLKVRRGLDLMHEDAQHWLADEYGKESFDDLLVALGGGDTSVHAVAIKLIEYWQHQHEQSKEHEHDEPLELTNLASKVISSARLQVAGVSGLLTNLANCCCPLPGDEIVGFISQGKGAIVHRADCKNIGRYRQRERERLINVGWTGVDQKLYRALVVMTARDRSGLIRDIATVVSDAGVNMSSVRSNVGTGKELALINATLEIESLEQLDRLFKRLEKIKGVIHVERNLGKRKNN